MYYIFITNNKIIDTLKNRMYLYLGLKISVLISGLEFK